MQIESVPPVILTIMNKLSNAPNMYLLRHFILFSPTNCFNCKPVNMRQWNKDITVTTGLQRAIYYIVLIALLMTSQALNPSLQLYQSPQTLNSHICCCLRWSQRAWSCLAVRSNFVIWNYTQRWFLPNWASLRWSWSDPSPMQATGDFKRKWGKIKDK